MAHDELYKDLKACRDWIENTLRCYDRDNVIARRKGHTVLVTITDAHAERGRDLLRPRSERQPHLWRIPADTNYPPEAGQCDACGGYGCANCDGRGWTTALDRARKCQREACGKVLAPDHFPVYCSNDCAAQDA